MKGYCDSCGSFYEKNMVVLMDGQEYMFDCFECAITKLAPRCDHCETIIVGHGIGIDEKIYCCGHCASVDEFRPENMSISPSV